MVEPGRRFQVLKLFRAQDKLFQKAISRQVFSGCSVAFGNQNHQFFRSFGYVSEGQAGKVIELASSAQAMLQAGKNLEHRDGACWVWSDSARQIFAIFLPDRPAADPTTEQICKAFQSQLKQYLA